MIAGASRSLNKHEKNYSSFQDEMLAAVYAARTYRHLMSGCKVHLITNHEPLTYLLNNQDLTGQHARWALTMQELDITIVHRPGACHQNADVPSRSRLPSAIDRRGARMDEDDVAATVTTRKRYTVADRYQAWQACRTMTKAAESAQLDLEAMRDIPSPARDT